MGRPLATATLLIALAAAALAAYAASRTPAGAADIETRLALLEDQLSRVEHHVAALAEREPPPPSLLGLHPEGAPAGAPAPRAAAPTPAPGETSPGVPRTVAASAAEGAETLRVMVDEAVEKKAAEVLAMREKKPTLDAFARTLELDAGQRVQVERDVLACQHELKALLETPAADGTVFLDELIGMLAEGMARPGQGKERGARWYGRILSERVPGSDETYGQRAESMKARLRQGLQRTLTPKQHATFEAWQLDPSEIKDVPGSPWKELEARIVERAKELGEAGPR